jgi:hypothetical protein
MSSRSGSGWDLCGDFGHVIPFKQSHPALTMILAKLNPATVALLGVGLIVAIASAMQDARADEPRPAGPAQVPDARALVPGVDAAALIRSIREQESWIDRVESL